MTATLTLKRLFAAPPERVYAAWTDPARFAQWIGPVGVPCDVLAMSPIQGGAYHLVMRSSTGGTIQITGQFTRLSPHDRIEFTWNADWGQAPGGRKGGLASTITIRLRPAGEGTEMDFQHHLPDAEMVKGHDRGWASTFDKLQSLLET